MSFILGVDGGNTKTLALVARDDGNVTGGERRQGGDDLFVGWHGYSPWISARRRLGASGSLDEAGHRYGNARRYHR